MWCLKEENNSEQWPKTQCKGSNCHLVGASKSQT